MYKKPLLALFSIFFMGLLIVTILTLIWFYVGRIIMAWCLLGVYIFSVFFAFYILAKNNRRIETRIRWFIFIVCVPLVGYFTYIVLGRRYHKNQKNRPYKYKHWSEFTIHDDDIDNGDVQEIIDKHVDSKNKLLFQAAWNEQLERPYLNTKTQMLSGLDFAFNLIKDIEKSEEYILLNFYIIADGHFFSNVINAIEKKIKQGVKVFLIYDFGGSFIDIKKSRIKQMKAMGINVAVYSPIHIPWISWQTNYRNHRKDVSIDGRIGYLGGINIGDEYISLDSEFGNWEDCQARIEGPAVREIEKAFCSDWKYITKTDITTLEPRIGIKKEFTVDKSNIDVNQIIMAGPNHYSDMHLSTIMNLITNAKERIWISTPYFIPPPEIISSLINAHKNGVDVKLLLPGRSDKPILLNVSYECVKPLYQAGVPIYALNNSFLHAKSFIIDFDIAVIASTNLDFRSIFCDQQSMLLSQSTDLQNQLEQVYIQNLNNAYQFNFEPNSEINKGKRILIKIAGVFYPVL